MKLHNNKHNNINKDQHSQPKTTARRDMEHSNKILRQVTLTARRRQCLPRKHTFPAKNPGDDLFKVSCDSFSVFQFFFFISCCFPAIPFSIFYFFLTSLFVYLYFYSPVCISNHVISHNVFILVYFFLFVFYCSFLYHSRLPITTSINPIFINYFHSHFCILIHKYFLSICPRFFLSLFSLNTYLFGYSRNFSGSIFDHRFDLKSVSVASPSLHK